MINFLVSDLGIFAEQANGLAAGGKNKVKYFTPYASTFPIYRDFAKGKGFEHLEKILYFWEHVDAADAIVNFDVGNQDAIGWLRDKYPKKSIFGSGWGGKLEDDRRMLKKFIESMGLPMQGYAHIKGITQLRNFLKKNPNKYVKMNIFRDDMESFYAKDYDSVEMKLDQLAEIFGPHKEDYSFIVEDAIKTDVESGYDGFFNGTDYVKPYLIGYELHKALYIAKVTDEMPAPMKETMDKFRPLLRKLDYRGALSTEEMIISDKEHYFLDICSRLPAPLSALYPELITNWAEAVYGIGLGENVRLEIPYKYVGAFPLESEEARTNYVKIDVEKNWRHSIKYQMMASNEKGVYGVKGLAGLVVLIAGGNTVDEVLRKLKAAAAHVQADKLDTDAVNGIDAIKEVIKHGEKVGIEF